MTAFFTDPNGRVRVIPDGDPNYKTSGNPQFKAKATVYKKGTTQNTPNNNGQGNGKQKGTAQSSQSNEWVDLALDILSRVVFPAAQAAAKATIKGGIHKDQATSQPDPSPQPPNKSPKPVNPPVPPKEATSKPITAKAPQKPAPPRVELDIPYDSPYKQPRPYKPHVTTAPNLPSAKTLQYQQKLIEQAMGGDVFDQTDKKNPYDHVYQGQSKVTGQPVVEIQVNRDQQRINAMLNDILFKKRSTTFTPEQLEVIKQKIAQDSFTPEEARLLRLARTINKMINDNEALGLKNRNDALLTANVIQLIANNSLNPDKTLNQEIFKKTLAKFFIDQTHDNVNSIIPAIFARILHHVGESNLAYNTMGGPRVGWWGGDPSNYDPVGDPRGNQAHHFAAFLIAGLESPGRARTEAEALDDNPFYHNKADYSLSIKAIELATRINYTKNYEVQNIGKDVYNSIKR
jgi:hypothetical protein